VARTLDDFRTHVAALISRPAWRPPAAYAIGIATYSNRGDGCKVLDVRYPVINAGENAGFAALITELVGGDGSTGVVELSGSSTGARLAGSVLADGGAPERTPGPSSVDAVSLAVGACAGCRCWR
jgi:hypothetical protein